MLKPTEDWKWHIIEIIWNYINSILSHIIIPCYLISYHIILHHIIPYYRSSISYNHLTSHLISSTCPLRIKAQRFFTNLRSKVRLLSPKLMQGDVADNPGAKLPGEFTLKLGKSHGDPELNLHFLLGFVWHPKLIWVKIRELLGELPANYRK